MDKQRLDIISTVFKDILDRGFDFKIKGNNLIFQKKTKSFIYYIVAQIDKRGYELTLDNSIQGYVEVIEIEKKIKEQYKKYNIKRDYNFTYKTSREFILHGEIDLINTSPNICEKILIPHYFNIYNQMQTIENIEQLYLECKNLSVDELREFFLQPNLLRYLILISLVKEKEHFLEFKSFVIEYYNEKFNGPYGGQYAELQLYFMYLIKQLENT